MDSFHNSNIKVSVIVPIYNVQEYLKECLDSLAKQTLKEIEIIMVNDGSTDNSPIIASEYEKKYNNFHLINKPNGGLGQARNFGIPHAKGEYIAFVDSDDYMPDNAYEKLYNLAVENDCDIATGNVLRFNSKKTYASKLHSQGEFKRTKKKTTMRETPELIYDVTSWNKIYKHSFWIKNNLSFPEGIIYEDIPATIPAHYLSSSTAILSDIIYYWRERDGLTKSLSQQNSNIVNFLDRLKVLKMVDRFFENNVVENDLKQLKNYRWLSLDFNLFINLLDTVDENYRKKFMEELQPYINSMPNEAFRDLSPLDKIKYYYIKQGNMDKLLEIIRYSKKEGLNNIPITRKGNKFYAKTSFDIPEEELELSEHLKKQTINRKINSVSWKGNTLSIRGYAFKRHLSLPRKNNINLTAYAVNYETREKIPVSIKIERRKDVTYRNGGKVTNKYLMKRVNNYDWSGFQIDVDVTKLPVGNYEFIVNVDNAGFNYQFIVGGPVKGNKTRPEYQTMKFNKVSANYNAGWDLNIKVESMDSMIEYYEIKDNKIFLYGWTIYDLKEAKLAFNEWNKKIFKNIPLYPYLDKNSKIFTNMPKGSNQFYTVIKLKEIEKNSGSMDWYGNIRYKDQRYPLYVSSLLDDKVFNRNKMELKITKSSKGNLYINYKAIKNYLHEIKYDNNHFEVIIHANRNIFKRITEVNKINLIAKNNVKGQQVLFDPEKVDLKGKTLKFIFKIPVKNHNNSLFTFGIWDFFIGYTFKSGSQFLKRIAVAEEIYSRELKSKTHSYLPLKTDSGNFSLKVNQIWKWAENGPRRIEFIEKVIYPLMRKLPIKKKRVVFESYWGKSYSCNPRALYEYINDNHPEYDCIWCFQDESTKINGKGKRVRINTLKYYYYLATSKYFVNNVNFPAHYKKRKNTIEIQTMHGTPLKTLGLDVVDDFKKPGSKEQFLQKCRRWDYLLSPSKYVTEIVKSCYDYKNEIIEKGTPRNDYLFKNNTSEIINSLKEKMNIPVSKKVILYAPTWRVKDSFEIKLNLEEMKRKFSDEYVLILRLHHYAVSTLNGNIFNEFVLNGSDYEDIQQLYLVSDILITDYSSVMFDYAILKKPMLFFTYDYSLYANNLRGFYIDFEKEAPTPLLYTSEEVINAIENIDEVMNSSYEKVVKFREKYCQFETGNACENIFNTVFLKQSEYAHNDIKTLIDVAR